MHPLPLLSTRWRFRAGLVLTALLWANTVHAQTGDEGLDSLLTGLRESVTTADEGAFAALFSPDVTDDVRTEQEADMLAPGTTRRVLRELDRQPIGASAGGGYRVVLELFQEWPGRARVLTVGLTIRQAPGGGAWLIAGAERLSFADGLYRLRLETSTQYVADDLKITAPDFQVTLDGGAVFLLDSDEGISGLVLLGRGEMRFSPAPDAERGQLRLFSGADTLVAEFEHALIRLNPADYATSVTTDALLVAGTPDARLARRAVEVADRELPKTLSVDLREVSSEPWYLLPREQDIVAEVRTRRHGTLTYSRFGSQPEDVSLIDRERRLTIALYPSAERLAARSGAYADEELREYDVVHYDIDASLSPPRRFMRAHARMAIRARTALATMTLRLADPLVITSVSSVETGPLSHFRLRNQNAVIVRLPRVLQPDEGLTLLVTYSGLVRSQGLEDALQIGLDPLVIEPEPHLLLSSASYWYPQNPFTDYATATMRISVPRDFTCVASGTPGPGDPLTTDTPSDERIFTFHARQPLRYLALVVSRFTNVHRATLALGAEGGGGAVALSIDVNPLQRARARSLVAPTEEIIRFYASLLGEAPLPSMALAVVEADVPGGHSPGYMVMLNSPPFVPAVTWRNDPAAFQGFPEFFLAHELAHQWWGQTVGMKNYHERWISEGFAQYFAALYAERFRGERVFHDMLRQFRRWSLSESDKGPVHLGHRLGQLSGGSRVFRALVYNKGAAVLHMLRRLVGDDAFFLGLRRFYAAHKFRTAGTADLQRALEQEAGRPLDRFFDRWIYGSDLPRVVNRSNVVDGQAIVRLEQTGEQVFDLPVTVTLTHEDGSSRDVVAIMSEKTLEQRIESDRRVRQVRINRDSAALAEFEND